MSHVTRLLVAFLLAVVPVAVLPVAATASAPAAAPPLTDCSFTSQWSGGSPSTIEGGLHRITPTRLLDTRYTLGQIGAGCTVVVDTAGLVPATSTAVSMNVTAVDATGPGFVTAYPCDQAQPTASSLNTRAAGTVANAVSVPLEASRRVCLYTSVATQLIVDVDGWFGVAGEPFHGLTPDRLLDTRFGPRPDGGTGQLDGGSVTRVPIAGIGPVPTAATGVLVNVTVTDTVSAGYVTVFACGTTPPNASNVNFASADTRANQAIVGLDSAGALCVFSSVTVSLVLDVSGWFGSDDGDRLIPLVTTRVLDSRDGTGGWSTPIQPGETRPVDVGLDGSLGVGQNVVLNLVATNSNGPGYLALFPCGSDMPATSSLNLAPGQDIANGVSLPVGANGQVCVYSSAATDVVIDVYASFGAAGPLLGLSVSGGPLTTRFSPDAHNYGVVCQAGTNSWTVTTTAVHDAVVSVAGADAGGAVTVSPGQAVVVTATSPGGSPTEYWVRCLPPDFPALDTHRRDVVTPGWYLVAPTVSHYAVILDDHGGPVWYQDAGTAAIDVKLLPDGNVAWTNLLGSAYGTNPTGAYQERTFDGSLVRTWATVGTITDHHDLQPLANGNMMMISYHQRADVDVSSLGASYASPSAVVDNWLQEITPAGAVVWSWHSEDHIGVAETAAQVDNPAILQTPGWPTQVLDLLHTNSVDVDPVTGDVIVSARHLDAVFQIRRDPGQPDDGKVLWKLGGSAPTDPSTEHLTIVDDPFGGPRRQHDARLLPNGNVTMFDNQSFHPGTSSRGVEYAIDATAGTATLVDQWRRTDGQQAFGLGSMRRQDDGSTVIGWGAINQLLSDYLPGNTDQPAMTIFIAANTQNYRAVKLPLAALNMTTLRTTAG